VDFCSLFISQFLTSELVDFKLKTFNHLPHELSILNLECLLFLSANIHHRERASRHTIEDSRRTLYEDLFTSFFYLQKAYDFIDF